MKKTALYLIFAITFVVVCLAFITAYAEKNIQEKSENSDISQSLPDALDNFFPPKADKPVYLFRMLGMAKPFSGIVVDLFENDGENAMKNFAKFKQQYMEVSQLIPEWQTKFPLSPVDELESALKTGDNNRIMAAYEQVGQVCAGCHFTNMPKVQFKYHWGNFQNIMITDPVTKGEVSFPRIMQYLETNLTGISINVEQNQTENAQRQFSAFRERFQALDEACMNCHDTERYYYTSESLQKITDGLEKALKSSPVDGESVAKLAQEIGMESCFKCHLVHVPAAAAQLTSFK